MRQVSFGIFVVIIYDLLHFVIFRNYCIVFIVFEMMSRMEFAVLEMNINQIKPNYLSFLSGKNNYFVRLVSTSLEFLLCIMW